MHAPAQVEPVSKVQITAHNEDKRLSLEGTTGEDFGKFDKNKYRLGITKILTKFLECNVVKILVNMIKINK